LNSIFEQIGIYGITKPKETAILASILTGDPVLLIGAQGTAKTALVDAIGAAFAERDKRISNNTKDPSKNIFKYHSYDSSKLNFEDLVGFPNPEAMKQGKISYIHTPVTVWDKDLVCFDEFNRQEPARQNNIFELIRSRRLMGIPTSVKWVINCMNPFGMAGTEALDEALVDRHQWFIFISRFNDLEELTKVKIVSHMGPNDGVGLRKWTKITGTFDVNEGTDKDNFYKINNTLADAGDMIKNLTDKAGLFYEILHKEVGKGYQQFVSKFFTKFSKDMESKKYNVELSGRRAGMVYRALLAYRAIDMARCHFDESHALTELKEVFKQVLTMTIPIGIAQSNSSGIDSNAHGLICANVDLFSSFFKGNDVEQSISDLELIYELTTTTDIERKIELLTIEVKDDFVKNQIWTEIINQVNTKTSDNDNIKNAITISILGHIMTIKPEIIPKNMQSIISTLNGKNLVTLGISSNIITLRGFVVLYKEDIYNMLAEESNFFLKLQIKLMAEQFSIENLNRKISKNEFNRWKQNVAIACSSLKKTIEAKNIPSIKETITV